MLYIPRTNTTFMLHVGLIEFGDEVWGITERIASTIHSAANWNQATLPVRQRDWEFVVSRN